MADANANIRIDVDTSEALSQIKALQRQISLFHTSMAQSGKAAAAQSAKLQSSLVNSINATQGFSAEMVKIRTTSESFTNSLEKNKFSMGEYFRYAGASTKTFGKLFKTEFETIGKVSRERVKDLQTQYIKMGRDANGAMSAIRVRPTTLDLQNLGTQTAIAAQKQQLFNQLIKQGSTNLLNWGKNTQWAGRQLMVGFTIPLTIMGSVASKEFMKLEEQAIRFKRVYGDSFTATEETDKMMNQVRELASEFTKYGVEVEKTMRMAADAAAMGKEGADLLAQINQATRLAVLGGVEQEQALETTISLTSAFGTATEDLATKIDFLNAVENQTVVAIEDMTIAIPKAAPVIKQLGGDVEDLAFFLTAMKEGGINASEGANALKSGLASLINPTEKASEFMRGFGINIQGIVEANKGDVRGTVVQFARALDELDPLNRARAIEQLFGKFQFSRLSTLFQNVIKEGSQAEKVLSLGRQTAEELAILSERELKRVEDSPMYKFKKAIEDFQVSLAPVGEAFLKLVTPVIEFGTKVMEQFNNMSDGAKAFVTGAIAIGGVVAPALIMVIGLLANGLANTIKFGALISNTLRGASQSSNLLAEQFNYMNSEQIEAAAVAASLNQVHAKLRQTFTAEAAAVDRLTAAYTRAIVKQNQMMMASGGKGARAPKGYNQGVKSVPGPMGAGDIVPAMLAPGEAVIPAKKAKKYSSLIDAIFSDSLPGYRLGLNPFSMMMGRARVASRMPQSSLMAMISQGKGARYSNAFATGTGADYTLPGGLPNPKQKILRAQMERDMFGIDMSAGPASRPTYGYARTSPIQAVLNKIFGFKGNQFNAVTAGKKIGDSHGGMSMWTNPKTGKYEPNPNFLKDSLSRYGDVDVVTKNSVARRSQSMVGDALMDYNRQKDYLGSQSLRFASAPMRGATPAQIEKAMFDSRLGMPFGSYKPDPIKHPNMFSSNPRPPYVETYTPGGFGVDEISKIIAKDPAARKEIQAALRSSGLGRIRVTDQNFGAKLFKALGIPGFQDGILSIPGSGSEDKFPAMLAPGEAVIPADKAKKYRGFIEQMISGGIPGFKRGSSSVNFSHFGASQRLSAADAAALNVPGTTANYLKDLAEAAPNAEVRAIGSYGFQGDSGLNRQAARTGASAESYIRDFSGRSTAEKLGESIQRGGGDIADSSMMKDFEAYDKDLQERMIKARKEGAEKFVDTSDQLRDIRKREGKNFDPKKYGVLEDLEAEAAEAKLKGTKAGEVRNKARNRVRDIRFNTNKELNEKLKKTPAGQRVIDRLTNKTGSQAGKMRGSINRVLPLSAAVPLPVDAEKDRLKRSKEYNDGLAKSANTNSESKRTRKIAKDTVDGYANELERGKKKVAAAGKKQTQAQLEAEATARKKSDAARKGWETRRANQEAALLAQPAGKQSGRLRDRMSGIGSRFKGQGGKIAGVGGAATSVAMMASMMPGKVGETAQQLMMPLMALTMILPLLTGAMGMAIVGLGALVAAVVMTKMRFDDLQNKSMDLTESLGGGASAMEAFSQAAGKVSAGEIMDKRRSSSLGVFQIQPGKNTFGDSFMQSEAGAAMKGSVSQSLKTNGTEATQQMITNQLATAVASGAMSTEQARSVVASLSSELNNASFGISVNSTLTELLGPKGENLLEDPLSIRLAILDESQKNLKKSFINLGEVAGSTISDNVASGMGVLAAGGAGALGGAGVGLLLAPFTAGLSVPVGAAIGMIAGGITGLVTDVGGMIGSMVSGDPSRSDRIANASGASVAMAKIALQQQQEMMDSLELEYEQRISIAEAAGDLEEVERLTNQRIVDRARLLEENRQLVSDIQSGFSNADSNLKNALMSGVDKQMENQYKDTALADVVPMAKDMIETNVQDKEIQYLLKMQVASGEIDPMQMYDFLTRFDKGSVEQDAIINMIAQSGGAFANQTMGLMSLFEDKKIQSDILLKMQATGDSKEAAELLSFYQALSQTDAIIDREAKFRFILDNPSEAEDLQTRIAEIKNLSEKDLTAKAYVEVLDANQLKILNSDLEYFNKLSPEMKRIYLQSLVTVETVTTADSTEFNAWKASQGLTSLDRMTSEEQYQKFAVWRTQQVTNMAEDTTATAEETPNTGGGGGPKASAFDGLLTQLRDVRDATIGVKKGFAAATAALTKLFDGGNKSIKVFDGLANQMRKLGAGEGMINAVLGMDPDEYEERKDELFNFDKNGKITGVTKKFKSLAAAINSIAIGEYVNDQEQFIANTNDQFTAINKLTAAGMSFSDAYKLVANQALATAIATSATTAEMKKLLEISDLLNKTTEKKIEIDEKAQAVDSVKRTNKDFRERYQALGKLSKDTSMSDAQITEILSDPNLTTLYLNPSLDPRQLEERLRQAEARANLEVRLKFATEEGKQDLFDEAMGDINDQFARKEAQIDIDFRLATEADSDIVRDAQNKISAIQFEIDDYQAELKGIADTEEEINERYDKRYEALEKVATAQEQISRAQKAQLDIADALSRGDIAGAARAQQELRDQEAQASREERRAQLERSQAAEIANVRSKSGKSREELEDAVKAKQDEIFNIEEETLEPAQERIRVAEYGKEVAIDNLEIAGRTRDQWEKIANSVDLATVNAEEFAKTIERALALYEYFVNGKPLDANLFGQEELDELIESGQVNAGDVINGDDVDVSEIIPEVVKAQIDAGKGDEVDDTQLTERQLAAKNLYEVNRSVRKELDDKDTAPKLTLSIAKKAGIIDSSGKMTMTADRAESAMQKALRDEQIARDRTASAAYAKTVGTTNPDRLDAAYQRDLSSQGISTNVGKNTPAQQVSSNYQARIIADKRATPAVLSTTAKNIVAGTGSKALNDPLNIRGAIASISKIFSPKPAPKPAPRPVYSKPPSGPPPGVSIRAMMRASGGVIPGYAIGGKATRGTRFPTMGSDTVPAMLTPGEFVIRRPAVQKIGLDKLEGLNKTGTYNGGSVYNYSLAVNVSSTADPNKIANTVMREIRRVESQRIRGNRV
jgi:TP901 family phage tail tape measure protein